MGAININCEFTTHVHHSHSETHFRWPSSVRFQIVFVFGLCSFVRWLSNWNLVVVRVTDVAADFRNMNPVMLAAGLVDQRDRWMLKQNEVRCIPT